MTGETWGFAGLALAAVLSLAGVLYKGRVDRRTGAEANQTAGWTALTAAHRSEIDRLREDMGDLRREVNAVRRAIEHERQQRHSLAEVLRLAWGHIVRLGEQIRDMGAHPEPPPPELSAWMERDGLVVDRVETTVSRTVVTNSHDGEQIEHTEVDMSEPLDTRPRDLR